MWQVKGPFLVDPGCGFIRVENLLGLYHEYRDHPRK